MLQSSCAWCHQMPPCPSPGCHYMGATSWSHTPPFHCCSFSPFLISEHLVSIREGATSAPCQCLYIPPPHPLLADGALLLTPVTQDENHTEKSSVSQVIIVNVCGPFCLQPPWSRQVLPGCSVPVSHDQPSLSAAGAGPCCSTAPWPMSGLCLAVSSQCTLNLCLCPQARDFHMDLLKMCSWTWQLLSQRELQGQHTVVCTGIESPMEVYMFILCG